MFDGHGGVDAAIYAANQLHVNLVRQESFSHDPSEALCRAFKLTDEGFVKKARREVNRARGSVAASVSLLLSFMSLCLQRVCVPQHLRCGTTGVVTFLRGRTLYVAWLGDSQVILVRRGQVVELMKPHKPDREVTRSEVSAPACVLTGREKERGAKSGALRVCVCVG